MSTMPSSPTGPNPVNDDPIRPSAPTDFPADGLPPMAWRLGYGGLFPFVMGALLVWLVNDQARACVSLGLAGYGAVIVSFLGGIHWGHAMQMPPNSPAASSALVWGVMPSLVAWMGLVMPPYAGLVILGVALVGCYLVDRRRYAAQGLSAWLTLRFRLTAIAALSCFLGAAGVGYEIGSAAEQCLPPG